VPYVKIDCGILNSTLWVDRDAREVFLTALLMAEPILLEEPTPEIATRALDHTDFVVPPGLYGKVPAASVGIISRAGIQDIEVGMAALERLATPEPESRSPEWEGRRLVRVDGGFIVLNFEKYRQKDHTGAARAKRYRDKKRDEGLARQAELDEREY